MTKNAKALPRLSYARKMLCYGMVTFHVLFKIINNVSLMSAGGLLHNGAVTKNAHMLFYGGSLQHKSGCTG